jgi:hypothetical protein
VTVADAYANAALLIGAIGGLITAITTSIAALLKARHNDVALEEVTRQVTPTNGEPLAGLVEEAVEHVRANSRRLDFHDEVLTRIARGLDRINDLALIPGPEVRDALEEFARRLDDLR